MSGMQDVALLAEKYESLSLSSQKLNASIIRMKNEVRNIIVNNLWCERCKTSFIV